MNKSTRELLKQIPRTACFKCKKIKTYLNPVETCYECGNKFCFDHLYGKLFREGMSISEEHRDVCEKCKEQYGYQSM